jgi:hypothetical protein
MPTVLSSRVWVVTWRAALISLAYAVALVVTGGLASALGWFLPAPTDNSLVLTLLSGACIGLTAALITWQAAWSRWHHFVIAACTVFFTMLSSTIEGAFFAPKLVGSLLALHVHGSGRGAGRWRSSHVGLLL